MRGRDLAQREADLEALTEFSHGWMSLPLALFLHITSLSLHRMLLLSPRPFKIRFHSTHPTFSHFDPGFTLWSGIRLYSWPPEHATLCQCWFDRILWKAMVLARDCTPPSGLAWLGTLLGSFASPLPS